MVVFGRCFFYSLRAPCSDKDFAYCKILIIESVKIKVTGIIVITFSYTKERHCYNFIHQVLKKEICTKKKIIFVSKSCKNFKRWIKRLDITGKSCFCDIKIYCQYGNYLYIFYYLLNLCLWMFHLRIDKSIIFAGGQIFYVSKLLLKFFEMDSNSYLYLTQNNQRCIKICVTGTRDPITTLAILMNSFVKTRKYYRQCKNGMYLYRTGYTELDINRVFDLFQGIVHGSFDHEDCDKGTFVKTGITKKWNPRDL